VLVLERAQRIGGRALTVDEPALGGAAFDHGASWLHAAETNPLVPLAAAAGAQMLESDDIRTWRTMIGDRPATTDELAAANATEARLSALLEGRVASGMADTSLASALDGTDDDPWAASFEAWEGPVIAASDADRLSLRDWAANRLSGRNLLVAGGLGRMLANILGPPAGPIALGTPVQRIDWGSSRLRLTSTAGEITAGGCIVTVSTGVLAAGAIRFIPTLPDQVRDAIAGLPMGLLTKVALRAVNNDRLDLPDWSAIDRRLDVRGEPAMVFTLWPEGRDYITGYIGGSQAWALAGDDTAAVAFARDELTRLLGARARAAFAGGAAVVTAWGTDPCTLGAYCYARPGHADARVRLGAFGSTGRLVFAGEATHPHLAGTVAGAYETGLAAADWLLQAG
jgi:monoamine oxidase